MMQCRYDWLQWLMEGYQKTGQLLIGYQNGALVPFNGADDIGMYCMVPKIAQWFSLSLDQAIAVFYYGMALIACSLALFGFFLLYRAWLPRVVVVLGIVWLSRGCLRIADVYATYAIAALAVTPLWLYGVQQNQRPRWFMAWSGCVGLILGFLHYVRALSGMPVLVFMLITLVLNRWAWRDKVWVVGVVLAGIVVPVVYFSAVYDQYVAYAMQYLPGAVIALKTHVFWHQLYIGLGFLSNPFGIAYNDSIGFAKARSVNPNVISCSPEYEMILRNEVIALVIQYPMFVLKTIFAKCGVIFLYLARVAHVGLIAAVIYRKPWQLELAFAGALAASALFAVLTDPDYSYLLGFIAFAVMYAIISINYALEKAYANKPFALKVAR